MSALSTAWKRRADRAIRHFRTSLENLESRSANEGGGHVKRCLREEAMGAGTEQVWVCRRRKCGVSAASALARVVAAGSSPRSGCR